MYIIFPIKSIISRIMVTNVRTTCHLSQFWKKSRSLQWVLPHLSSNLTVSRKEVTYSAVCYIIQKGPSTHHCSSGLKKPVKSELRRVANTLSQFIINIFFVKSKFVKHTDQKTILFFSVVFSFVSTIWYSQLMKRCFVPSNLSKSDFILYKT